MRGLCDAPFCVEGARYYATIESGQKRVGYNLSACDWHQTLTVEELAKLSGNHDIQEHARIWRHGCGAEAKWERIGGT